MKKVLFLFLTLISITAAAQVDNKLPAVRFWGSLAVGKNDFINPDSCSYLDIGPTVGANKGLLLRPLSVTGIVRPKPGLFGYNMSDSTLYSFNGIGWQRYMKLSDTNIIKDLIIRYAPAPDTSAFVKTVNNIQPVNGNVQLNWNDVLADQIGSAQNAVIYAIQRANHTGTQPINTVDGLQDSLTAKANRSDITLQNATTPYNQTTSGIVITGQDVRSNTDALMLGFDSDFGRGIVKYDDGVTVHSAIYLNGDGTISILNSNNFQAIVNPGHLTGPRVYFLPDTSGTVALKADIPGTPGFNTVTGIDSTTTHALTITGSQLYLSGSSLKIQQAGRKIVNIIGPSVGGLGITDTLPSSSGTFALRQDLSGYASYTANFNSQSGTSYTLQASDNGKVIDFSSSAAVTLTIPMGLPVGFNCLVHQSGTGQITFSASGTAIHNRQGYTQTAGQYSIGTILCIATNIFTTSGDLQ